jgi:hypothetical protein
MGKAATGLFYPGKEARPIQARAFAPAPRAFVPYPLLNSPEASSYKLSIGSGCPSFCRFCMESWDRKPYRERSLEALVEEARSAKRALGASTLDISSFNFNAHSDIIRLMLDLSRLYYHQNAMSQRADILENLPGLLAFEFASGKRSYTVGVEGISERMRRYYAKEVDARSLTSLLSRLIAAGAREIKLFYIVSGFETEDDQAEFAAFVKELKRIRSDASSGTRIIFSAGYLTRMPGTPLAFAPLELEESRLRRISGPLKSSCETNGFEFRMPAFFDEYAIGQVLALGGAGLFDLLLEMARAGFCYDGKLSRGAWAFAFQRLNAAGLLSAEFYGEKAPGYPFSLGFLDFATDAGFRYERYADARAALSPSRASRREAKPTSCLSGACMACGACPPQGEQMSSILGHQIAAPSLQDAENAERLLKLKSKAGFINVRIVVPAELYGAEDAYLAACYLRRILAERPEQTDNILECEECLFTQKESRDRFPSFSGPTLFRIRAYDLISLKKALAGLSWLSIPATEPSVLYGLSGARARIFFPTVSGATAELEKTLCAYLDEEVASYTLSRGADGGAAWEISRGGLKKRIATEAKMSVDESGRPLLEVDIGSRFDFSRFLAIYRRSYPEKALPWISFLSIDPERKKPY